jgi:hypothetical protein
MEKCETHQKYLSEDLKAKGHLGDLGVEGETLICIFEKKGVKS